MRIAVDAHGGDNAPLAVIKGSVMAASEMPVDITLVGIPSVIEETLASCDTSALRGSITIEEASQIIENEDSPVIAVRRKPDSSMVKAIDMVKAGRADAVLSAGNTGALMTGALLHLGRIKGLERPAIVAMMPRVSTKRGFYMLLDAGANSECKSSNLVSFAHMGSIYMRTAFAVEDPRVGLINIGAEETKGTPVIKETYQRLKEDGNVNFIGNVEARDIPSCDCDVLVCDGFTGNVVLKLQEGLASSMLHLIKEKILESSVSKVGGLLIKSKMSELKTLTDYSTYGAAPILGVRGLVFKMHGSSDSGAVCSAIAKAVTVAEGDVIGEITSAMEKINAEQEA